MTAHRAGHDLGPPPDAVCVAPLPARARHVVTAVHAWVAVCASLTALALFGSSVSRQEAKRVGVEADAIDVESTGLEVEAAAERRRAHEAGELRAWLEAAPDLQRLLLALGKPVLGGGYARRIAFEPDAAGGPVRVRLEVVRTGQEGRQLVAHLGEALGNSEAGPAIAESTEFGEAGGNVTFRCQLPAWEGMEP